MMKKKLPLLKKCCLGFSLDDGIHGIVAWDNLYALFVITTSVNTLVYFADKNKAYVAFTDMVTAAFLVVRAVIGMWTCCKNFAADRVRKYFIMRLIWDAVLLIGNSVMVALKKMPL